MTQVSKSVDDVDIAASISQPTFASISRRALIEAAATLALIARFPFVAAAVDKPNTSRWVDVGDVRNFRLNEPKRVRTREGDVVFVTRLAQAKWLALSSRCTHLGCDVQWENADHRFLCPCHGSEFTQAGAVERGPAKRALTHLPVRVKGNRVFVDVAADLGET